MAGRKGVFFDTSTWSPIDLLDFYRQIPPEQVVYASRYPYGQQPDVAPDRAQDGAARRATTTTSCARCSAGPRTRSPTARELPEPTTPLGKDTLSQPMQLARIHQYLSMATPLLWTRQPDTIGVLGLAINTCAERNGHVEAVDQIERAARGRARPLGGGPVARTRPGSLRPGG